MSTQTSQVRKRKTPTSQGLKTKTLTEAGRAEEVSATINLQNRGCSSLPSFTQDFMSHVGLGCLCHLAWLVMLPLSLVFSNKEPY